MFILILDGQRIVMISHGWWLAVLRRRVPYRGISIKLGTGIKIGASLGGVEEACAAHFVDLSQGWVTAGWASRRRGGGLELTDSD
jgi:hypothetical protein